MAHGWAKWNRGPAAFAELLKQARVPLPLANADVELANADRAAEAWTDRRCGLDARVIALCFEFHVAVDDHTPTIEPNIPKDFMPFVRGEEAFVRKAMLFSRLPDRSREARGPGAPN
jgi:hypothetical protein